MDWLDRGKGLNGLGRVVYWIGVTHLHVESERLHFLYEHVEGLRYAGLQAVVAFHNALVYPRPPLHVVGFDRQQFLERVTGSVGFHGPDFHFAETLAAVLRLATQRLLDRKSVV